MLCLTCELQLVRSSNAGNSRMLPKGQSRDDETTFTSTMEDHILLISAFAVQYSVIYIIDWCTECMGEKPRCSLAAITAHFQGRKCHGTMMKESLLRPKSLMCHGGRSFAPSCSVYVEVSDQVVKARTRELLRMKDVPYERWRRWVKGPSTGYQIEHAKVANSRSPLSCGSRSIRHGLKCMSSPTSGIYST